MPLTEESFLGTWKFDETIKDKAVVDAFFDTVEEANDWSAYAPDVLEFKLQGDNTYLEGGLCRHRFFMQVTVRDSEINFIIRYYIQSKGNWSYDASSQRLTEVNIASKVMCMDEETEKETQGSEDLRSLFDKHNGETELYLVQFINEDELVITEDELNLRLHLRRVSLEQALEIKE